MRSSLRTRQQTAVRYVELERQNQGIEFHLAGAVARLRARLKPQACLRFCRQRDNPQDCGVVLVALPVLKMLWYPGGIEARAGDDM
jgi:hypothetical protein